MAITPTLTPSGQIPTDTVEGNVKTKENDTNTETAELSKGQQNFENQLNQQGIITLDQSQDGLVFDTASDIEKNGDYSAPGQSNPI